MGKLWGVDHDPAQRLLVVDDEHSIVDAVSTALRYEGFDVTEAASGRAALAVAQEQPFGLVLLDVMLPDLDGFEVAARLRADGIDTPILFLTARSGLDDKAKAFGLGADDHVTKPFSLAEIVMRVRAILRRSAATGVDAHRLEYAGHVMDTDGAFDAFAVPAPNGTFLDPSGVVKGWSIERAAELLETHGLRDFPINAGGDIARRGRPAPGAPWRVGVRHPELSGRLAVVLEIDEPTGVATSATYERGARIVDPRTGNPTTDLASATVVGPDLTFADAYATAVFVMGLAGLEWLSSRPATRDA